MNEIELFKEKYKNLMERKGLKVKYFGSTRESWRWTKGRSDLDIFVYGDNIPPEVKAYGVLLIRDLNYELGLNLDDVPFQHWTPVYIDWSMRLLLKRLSEEEIIRSFTENVRKAVKEVSRFWWPFTYRQWWGLVDFAYRHRLSPLPLPPPYPPIPPLLFLKLL
jgi:predicted nucleotidyltransferase